MKKLLLLVTILSLFNFQLRAAEQITTVTDATITSLLQGPKRIDSIDVLNSHPSDAVSVYFYDAPTNILTYIVASYTGLATRTTNVVRSITNYFGVVRTETNSVHFNYLTTVAAQTNTYPLLKAFTSLAAGASTNWTPTGGRFLGYGLAATNSATNTVITVNYGSAF